MATYSISTREDVRDVEDLAAHVESARAPVAATAGETVRVAVYVAFALAATAFLVATLVLYLA